MQMQALSGATIIITRPTASAAPLKRRVLALGGEALMLPAMSLRQVADGDVARRALDAAQAADIAVFSSPSAVRFAFALQPGLKFSSSTRIAAIGAATAQALLRHPIAGVLWPRHRHDSEALLALPELHNVRGDHVVLIGAPAGRDLLAQTFRARGANVTAVAVYQRTLPRLDRRHFLRLEQARRPLITLLSSQQALANLQVVLRPDLFARLTADTCVVSSARLAVIAREAGFARVHLAHSAMPPALIQTACTALAQHRL